MIYFFVSFHLPAIESRSGESGGEETDKTQSPSAIIYAVPLTVRYLRFTSTPAGSKLIKRISSMTRGSYFIFGF